VDCTVNTFDCESIGRRFGSPCGQYFLQTRACLLLADAKNAHFAHLCEATVTKKKSKKIILRTAISGKSRCIMSANKRHARVCKKY
jgi:hypothetical protein